MKYRTIWPIACILAAITLTTLGLSYNDPILRWGFIAAAVAVLTTGLVVRFSKRWEDS